MAEYKVLKDFTFRGAKRVAGEVIILTETKLEGLTEEGFRDHVELLDGSLPQSSMSDENTGAPVAPETPVTPSNEGGEGATPETPATEGAETPASAEGAATPAPEGAETPAA